MLDLVILRNPCPLSIFDHYNYEHALPAEGVWSLDTGGAWDSACNGARCVDPSNSLDARNGGLPNEGVTGFGDVIGECQGLPGSSGLHDASRISDAYHQQFTALFYSLIAEFCSSDLEDAGIPIEQVPLLWAEIYRTEMAPFMALCGFRAIGQVVEATNGLMMTRGNVCLTRPSHDSSACSGPSSNVAQWQDDFWAYQPPLAAARPSFPLTALSGPGFAGSLCNTVHHCTTATWRATLNGAVALASW